MQTKEYKKPNKHHSGIGYDNREEHIDEYDSDMLNLK